MFSCEILLSGKNYLQLHYFPILFTFPVRWANSPLLSEASTSKGLVEVYSFFTEHFFYALQRGAELDYSQAFSQLTHGCENCSLLQCISRRAFSLSPFDTLAYYDTWSLAYLVASRLNRTRFKRRGQLGHFCLV